jgi:AraC family transcriptional regulator, positive regulator of tynA and feaB
MPFKNLTEVAAMLVQARSFSTKDLPRVGSNDAWHQFMELVYYRVNIKVDDDEWVRGELKELKLGELGISSFQADRQRVFRPKTAAATDPSDNYVFIFPRREYMYFDQRGVTGFVPPGSVVILRSSERYEASCPDGFENVTIKAPTALLDGRIRGIDELCAKVGVGNSPLARIVGNMAEELIRSSNELPARSGPQLAENLTSLLTLMLEDATSLGARESATPSAMEDCFRRVCAYVRARLSDPDLSPLEAAQSQGISLRYLHRLFQLRGVTFGRWLLKERLAAARRLIEAGARGQVSLHQVAYKCGFASQAHFSTRYHERFGERPRDTLKNAR